MNEFLFKQFISWQMWLKNSKIRRKTQNLRLSEYLVLVQRAQNSASCVFFAPPVRVFAGSTVEVCEVCVFLLPNFMNFTSFPSFLCCFGMKLCRILRLLQVDLKKTINISSFIIRTSKSDTMVIISNTLE